MHGTQILLVRIMHVLPKFSFQHYFHQTLKLLSLFKLFYKAGINALHSYTGGLSTPSVHVQTHANIYKNHNCRISKL